MTTILADAILGLMVADSNVSDTDRHWAGKKVFRHRGDLIGCSGPLDEIQLFKNWYLGGMVGKKPKLATFHALILNQHGLFSFYHDLIIPLPVQSGRDASGSGAKAAMCAYEALGWKDPKRAVQIVCRHDAGSRGPVRVYHLKKHEPNQTG